MSGDPLRAHEYSVDGLKWKEIPDSIDVLGSRYALVIKNLREEDRRRGFSPDGSAIGPFATSYAAYRHAMGAGLFGRREANPQR
jgi:hypothetical protein